MQHYDARATSTASPDVIWRLLLDARSWPAWSLVDSLDTERSSGLDPGGRDPVGAVRAFRTGRMVTAERVTGLAEERQLAYEEVFNPMLRDYRAAIDLRPAPGGGTVIRWHGTYTARWGLGLLMRPYLQRFMQGMANGLASHADTLRLAKRTLVR